MEINEKAEKAQGAKTVKKQGISKTYTLRQMGNMIDKVVELKWVNKVDEEQLRRIREICKAEFIKGL